MCMCACVVYCQLMCFFCVIFYHTGAQQNGMKPSIDNVYNSFILIP